jgi:hypothetical protein
MKKILFLLFVSVNVFSQSVDYNKIILPEHIQSPDFGEKIGAISVEKSSVE